MNYCITLASCGTYGVSSLWTQPDTRWYIAAGVEECDGKVNYSIFPKQAFLRHSYIEFYKKVIEIMKYL